MPKALRRNSPVFFASRAATVTNPRTDSPARWTFGFAGCARNTTLPSGSVKRPNVPSSPSTAVFTPFFLRSAIIRFRSDVMKPIPDIPSSSEDLALHQLDNLVGQQVAVHQDRKSTRLNSSH